MVIAAVAQSVEQWTENPRVISSILIGGTQAVRAFLQERGERFFYFHKLFYTQIKKGAYRTYRPCAAPKIQEVIVA